MQYSRNNNEALFIYKHTRLLWELNSRASATAVYGLDRVLGANVNNSTDTTTNACTAIAKLKSFQPETQSKIPFFNQNNLLSPGESCQKPRDPRWWRAIAVPWRKRSATVTAVCRVKRKSPSTAAWPTRNSPDDTLICSWRRANCWRRRQDSCTVRAVPWRTGATVKLQSVRCCSTAATATPWTLQEVQKTPFSAEINCWVRAVQKPDNQFLINFSKSPKFFRPRRIRCLQKNGVHIPLIDNVFLDV